jgi:hypothetical protein
MLHGIRRILATLVFVLLMLGMNTNARAQQTPMTITYEQTIQGSLDATDPAFEDGPHYDQYIFQAEAGRSYEITVQSDTFAAWVDLSFGEEVLQGAFVLQPGAQVQFSGILTQPGQYTILLSSFEVGTLGPYTLTLSEGQPPGSPPPGSPPPEPPPPEPPPGGQQDVGGLASFTCDTVSCPGADDQSDTAFPDFGEIVSCTWHCATFENVPNQFVVIDFFRPSGGCWELSTTFASDGIC